MNPRSAAWPTSVDLLHGLEAGVDALVGLDLDTIDDGGISRLLAAEERAIRRLQAHQSHLARVLTRRRSARARAERPDGDLTDHHVHVIAEVTAHAVGDDRHAFEAQLVELAGRCRDAVVFGREARRLLAERDHDAAMADLERKRARRSGRVAQTPDGTTVLRLDTVGLDGELVHTVVEAFLTPDARGEHRTADQRTHDARILLALTTDTPRVLCAWACPDDP